MVCRAGLELSHPRRQRRLCGWWGDNLVIKRFPALMRTRTPLPEPGALEDGLCAAVPGLSQSRLCADTPTTLQECGPAKCRTILEQPHLSPPPVIGSGDRGQRSRVKAAHPSIQPTRPCPPWRRLLQGVGLSGDFGNFPQRRGSVQLKWLVWRSPRPLCPLGWGTEQGSKGPPQGRGQQGPGWSRRGHISQSNSSSQAWSGGGQEQPSCSQGSGPPPQTRRQHRGCWEGLLPLHLSIIPA